MLGGRGMNKKPVRLIPKRGLVKKYDGLTRSWYYLVNGRWIDEELFNVLNECMVTR